MTTNAPWPGNDGHGGRNPGGHAPLPQQANPTWMGQVQQRYYRQAPVNDRGRLQPLLPPAHPAVPRTGSSAGVAGLVLAGAVLGFVSLFLVLPFVLENTGITGFVIGFVASLLPLGSVLLAVYVIDRWEPEPKRLLLFAFVWGAVVSISVTLLIQPVFSLAGPASGWTTGRSL